MSNYILNNIKKFSQVFTGRKAITGGHRGVRWWWWREGAGVQRKGDRSTWPNSNYVYLEFITCSSCTPSNNSYNILPWRFYLRVPAFLANMNLWLRTTHNMFEPWLMPYKRGWCLSLRGYITMSKALSEGVGRDVQTTSFFGSILFDTHILKFTLLINPVACLCPCTSFCLSCQWIISFTKMLEKHL